MQRYELNAFNTNGQGGAGPKSFLNSKAVNDRVQKEHEHDQDERQPGTQHCSLDVKDVVSLVQPLLLVIREDERDQDGRESPYDEPCP